MAFNRDRVVVVNRLLAARVKEWRKAIPKDAEPVILAILANDTVVDAHRISPQGHHGVLIEGTLFSPDDASGASPCIVVAHQANLHPNRFRFSLRSESNCAKNS
jgi:hypothetical protein